MVVGNVQEESRLLETSAEPEESPKCRTLMRLAASGVTFMMPLLMSGHGFYKLPS